MIMWAYDYAEINNALVLETQEVRAKDQQIAYIAATV